MSDALIPDGTCMFSNWSSISLAMLRHFNFSDKVAHCPRISTVKYWEHAWVMRENLNAELETGWDWLTSVGTLNLAHGCAGLGGHCQVRCSRSSNALWTASLSWMPQLHGLGVQLGLRCCPFNTRRVRWELKESCSSQNVSSVRIIPGTPHYYGPELQRIIGHAAHALGQGELFTSLLALWFFSKFKFMNLMSGQTCDMVNRSVNCLQEALSSPPHSQTADIHFTTLTVSRLRNQRTENFAVPLHYETSPENI